MDITYAKRNNEVRKFVSLDDLVEYFNGLAFDHGCEVCPAHMDSECIECGAVGKCRKKIADAILNID